ncbi:hypothetical protein Pelo_12254 [Pelomyxa schiedti]|nr:hypothetical protein Pelo_12254 [Pelomyxa schiedti]
MGDYWMSPMEYFTHCLGIWNPVIMMGFEKKHEPIRLEDDFISNAVAMAALRYPFLRAKLGPPSDRYVHVPAEPESPSQLIARLPMTVIHVNTVEAAWEFWKETVLGFWQSTNTWKCTLVVVDAIPKFFVVAQFAHCVMDGLSMAIFARDILKALNCVPLDPPQPIPPPHGERVPGSEFVEPQSWEKYYLEIRPILESMVGTAHPSIHTFSLSKEETSALAQACRRHGVTVTSLLLAAMMLGESCKKITAYVPVNLRQPGNELFSVNTAGLPLGPYSRRLCTGSSSGQSEDINLLWEMARDWHNLLVESLPRERRPGGQLLRPQIEFTTEMLRDRPLRPGFPDETFLLVSNLGDIGRTFGIDAIGESPTASYFLSDFMASGGNSVTPEDPLLYSATAAGKLSCTLIGYAPPDTVPRLEALTERLITLLTQSGL